MGSKKYLRVNDKPRTISVRNRVFMLRSKTAKPTARIAMRLKKKNGERCVDHKKQGFTSIPVLGDFLSKLLLFFIICEILLHKQQQHKSSTASEKKTTMKKCCHINKHHDRYTFLGAIRNTTGLQWRKMSSLQTFP